MNNILALDPIFIEIGPFVIRWYAVFILIGAALAYYLSRRFFKKANYNPEIVDNLFLICFPMGIIGARIWFVLSNIPYYQDVGFQHIFFLWDGGLAVQGGVILGALSGLWYLKKYHKEVSILHAFDLIVPNILVAQSIGRWGNFMNQEVYGACVSRDSLWFLPNFILDQMSVCGTSGKVAQPLFLYESLLTLTAFIIISLVLRKYWTSRKVGYLGSLYFIAYGVIRGPLELLRDPTYIMTIFGIPTSVITSIAYVILGICLMVFCYKVSKKKESKEGE